MYKFNDGHTYIKVRSPTLGGTRARKYVCASLLTEKRAFLVCVSTGGQVEVLVVSAECSEGGPRGLG